MHKHAIDYEKGVIDMIFQQLYYKTKGGRENGQEKKEFKEL